MNVPKPPDHLRPSTRKWWSTIVNLYDLEVQHLSLLTMAAEALDRGDEARESIARDGAYFAADTGAPRKHPALGVERDSRILFARLMRELDLDGAPQPDIRVPRIGSRT